ncbi:MAG: 16S rRNA (uracil(1498)-N(3))-methyltransferase [Marmoricola sp.]
MTLPVFWAPDLAAAGVPRVGGTVALGGDEGHHAAVVRRLRAGEDLVLTDGAGTAATARVHEVSRSGLVAEVLDVRCEPAATPRLTVLQALAKGERGELAVELMTEIGVDRVVPWAASRSVAVWRGERGAKPLARWRATAVSAAKQSRRVWFPEVADPVDRAGAVAEAEAADVVLVLHEEADVPLRAVPMEGAAEVALVVGPEGGIAPEELAALRGAGPHVHVVRLGPTVMRTSTAGAAAASALLARTDRWR